MRRIAELDGIRAIAIFAVIACHYYPFSTMLFQAPEFGWAGVDLFFVLSGFLITSILLQLKTRPHPYKVFYVRRILRIFPPYYAVMAVTYLIAWLQHDRFSRVGMIGKALFLQSFANEFHILGQIFHQWSARHVPDPFAIKLLPQNSDGLPVAPFVSSFSPTWSLSIEEWFYLLWAPLVLRLRRHLLWAICIASCAGALVVRWFGFLGVSSYFDFFSRIDVLLGGALLALWMEHRESLPATSQVRGDRVLSIASAICGVLLVSLLFAIRPILGHEIRESLLFIVFGLPLLAACFAGVLGYVVCHAGGSGFFGRLLRLRPLVAVGTISYTLYLIHAPIYVLAHQAAALLGISSLSWQAALALSTISVAASLGVAFLSFRFYESPILEYKDALTKRVSGEQAKKPPIEQMAT